MNAEEPSKQTALCDLNGDNLTQTNPEYDLYFQRLSETYLVMFYLKLVFVALILAFIVLSIWRSHRLTFFQWFQLAQIVALSCIELPYFIGFQHAEDDMCRSVQKIYGGATYCLLLGISLLLSWQFHAFFRQVYAFVRHGVLPTEGSRRRNKILLFGIWFFFLVDWIIFIFVDDYISDKGMEDAMYYYEFMQSILIVAAILFTCKLYIIASYRIYKLSGKVQASVQITYMKRVSWAALVFHVTFFIITVLQLSWYGDFGLEAQFAYIANIVMFYLLQCFFFWMVIANDLDLILQSKVLVNGQIVLIGIS